MMELMDQIASECGLEWFPTSAMWDLADDNKQAPGAGDVFRKRMVRNS